MLGAAAMLSIVPVPKQWQTMRIIQTSVLWSDQLPSTGSDVLMNPLAG